MLTELLTLANKLKSINRRCYAVGSFCIHKILEKEFHGDIDLATDATPEEIASILTVVGEIGKKYGTLIVKESKKTFEITTFRRDLGSVNHRKPATVIFTDSLEEDALRRDFTINAIYYDILNNSYIDPTGGINDVHKKIIRFVGEPEKRLDEDILRLLRYVRFRYSYGFRPAYKKYDILIQKRMGELQDISVERIRQEFDKILVTQKGIAALKFLKKSGFFKRFLPEVDVLSETCGGPKHHLEGSVWEHTLLVLKSLKALGDKNENLLLSWAALLHDIGKAQTFSKDNLGNVHYYDHENIGSEKIDAITKRWKMSIKFSQNLEWLVKNHLLPQKLGEMKKIKTNRLMIHPLFPTLLELSLADGLGKNPKYRLSYKKIMQQYSRFQKTMKETVFFTGEDVILRYPELQGQEIGKKFTELNNQLLAKI